MHEKNRDASIITETASERQNFFKLNDMRQKQRLK